jgi:glyoxylase-like metal-dependent hydrolase (beta-lactamase superfamily II)
MMTGASSRIARTVAATAALTAATMAWAQQTQYQIHVEAATRNAGSDPFFQTTLRKQWCFTAENTGFPPELGDRRLVPLTQIFDDMWFTGLRTVGQYIIKSSNGFFLIDTLNNASEAGSITVPALTQLGMSLQLPLTGAMPTHGHGDHHGGGAYLQQLFGIPIYLGSRDAANKPFVVTPVNSDTLAPQPFAVAPERTLTLLSTPGHTPGTMSGVVPVKNYGRDHKLAFWGGTAMPNSIDPALQYLDGSERLYWLAKSEGADGTMHTHPFVDGSLNHVDTIAAQGRKENPFILGKSQTLRSLAMLRECSAAKVAQVDATAIIPVWRVTTIEFLHRSPSEDRVSVKLSSAWGPVANHGVTFTVEDSSDDSRGHGRDKGSSQEICVAKTNAEGIAACSRVRKDLRPFDTVVATFEGAAVPDYVDLPSTASAKVLPGRR